MSIEKYDFSRISEIPASESCAEESIWLEDTVHLDEKIPLLAARELPECVDIVIIGK